MKTPNWIVVQDGTGDDPYSMHCLRCGAKQRFELPISITYWCSVAKVFEREHRRCKAVTPAEKPEGWSGP